LQPIAIVGAGAVGCYFGGLLAKAGAPVTLIGRARHVDAIVKNGLELDTLSGRSVVRIGATTDLSAVRAARVVLVSVKTPDTESVAKEIAPHLVSGALVLSMQNGVDNAEQMQQAAGIPAFAAAVYVAVEMVGPGQVRHTGRGDLAVGDVLADQGMFSRRSEGLAQLRDLFAAASVSCRIAEDIRVELWTKLAMNCAWNAISALTKQRYGVIARDLGLRRTIELIIGETVQVAAKLNIALVLDQLLEASGRLGNAMAEAFSSTAHDLFNGKPTEIDSLNGYVAAMGRRVGVATPVNDTIYALVKLAERHP
jgi:2-dehydropantoate 2-reductase